MSDLVVAVLQLTCGSSWNSPAKPLAVRPGTFGGGIFSQAFSNQLPHTNQVPISNLHRRNNMRGVVVVNCGKTPACPFYIDIYTLSNLWALKNTTPEPPKKSIHKWKIRNSYYLHLAAAADFPEPLLFSQCALGHVVPGPRNTGEPWQAETAAEKWCRFLITKMCKLHRRKYVSQKQIETRQYFKLSMLNADDSFYTWTPLQVDTNNMQTVWFSIKCVDNSQMPFWRYKVIKPHNSNWKQAIISKCGQTSYFVLPLFWRRRMSSDMLSAEPPVSPGSISSGCKKKEMLLVSRLQIMYKMVVRQSSLD